MSVSVQKMTERISYVERDQAGVDDCGAVIGGFGGVGVGALPPGCPPSAGVVVPVPGGCDELPLTPASFCPCKLSLVMLRYPACTKKSHTRLVLFTSILTRSRASRLRNFPPRRAYSRTSVSLMTRYGFGRIRSWLQSVCSSGVSRCSDGLFARLSGAAGG